MGALDDILAPTARPEPKAKAPAGWEPGLTWDGSAGTLITPPLDAEPDPAVWAELVADWGLDPERHRIVPGSLQFRGWDAPVGDGEVKRLRYYRATITDAVFARADVEELCRLAVRKKPSKPVERKTDGNAWLVVSLNDWQIGKGEGGGTPATVAAITAAIDGVRRKARELTRLGRRPGRIVLANTGDLTERTAGHYASQSYTTDLNDREQQRVARHLLWRLVDGLVTDGYGVTVTAVPCNHGENRNGAGKAQTTPDDNVSLTLVEGIEEACRANPDRYHDVDFAYATDLTLVLDVAGVNVGMTHGHQVRGSGSAAAKVEKWWQGQIMGTQPVAAADLLMTAHLHHLQLSEETGRTVIIAPAIDGGSYWYTSATGRNSPRGMLTLTVGDAHHRGWGDLEVIG
ncbi:MAG: hypothetical protein KA758_14730 [Acidimicrobiales bacterium]|nr:hypothetical protein [Acidimicrobiales bacterium]